MRGSDTRVTSVAMLDFLRWLAAATRTHAETLDVWQTACPRASVWEDAIAAGYVRVRRSASGTTVHLSDRGRTELDASPDPAGDGSRVGG